MTALHCRLPAYDCFLVGNLNKYWVRISRQKKSHFDTLTFWHLGTSIDWLLAELLSMAVLHRFLATDLCRSKSIQLLISHLPQRLNWIGSWRKSLTPSMECLLLWGSKGPRECQPSQVIVKRTVLTKIRKWRQWMGNECRKTEYGSGKGKWFCQVVLILSVSGTLWTSTGVQVHNLTQQKKGVQ